MDSRLSIFKNTLALSIPNVLNPFISFILVLVISRYLGVRGLGEYSLVLSYIGIFNTLAALGLEDLVVREVARRPDDAHLFFFNAGIFGSISSLVALVAMDALVAAMGYEKQVVYAAFVCSLALVASTTMSYMEAIFRSVEKAEYVAVTYVLENLLRVGVCVWLLLYGYGIVALFCGILGSRIFGLVTMSCLYVKVLGAL
ncbi:MAG: oligosaccharide flippase family protein [Desulfomonilaceae bacterium]